MIDLYHYCLGLLNYFSTCWFIFVCLCSEAESEENTEIGMDDIPPAKGDVYVQYINSYILIYLLLFLVPV